MGDLAVVPAETEIKGILEGLRDSAALQLPVARFHALKVLFFDALDTVVKMSPDFMLREFPKDGDDKNDYDELHALISQHVGRGVARSRLIGVATTILKEMGEIYKKELLPSLRKDKRLVEIEAETDPEKLRAEIVSMETHLAEAVKEVSFG